MTRVMSWKSATGARTLAWRKEMVPIVVSLVQPGDAIGTPVRMPIRRDALCAACGTRRASSFRAGREERDAETSGSSVGRPCDVLSQGEPGAALMMRRWHGHAALLNPDVEPYAG